MNDPSILHSTKLNSESVNDNSAQSTVISRDAVTQGAVFDGSGAMVYTVRRNVAVGGGLCSSGGGGVGYSC